MKRLLNLLKPYRLVIQTGDFDGCSHRAWTQADALSWARCYPNACQAWVFDRKGKAVLFRQGLR